MSEHKETIIDLDEADNAFIGTDDRDIVKGHGGNDTIEGRGGIDALDGGAGNDVLKGQGGHDGLSDGSGHDSLEGGDGDDRLDGGSGKDTLLGGTGDDGFNGGGDDRFDGGAGNDHLDSGAGNDTPYSGVGNDTVIGGEGDDIFYDYRGEGLDSLSGGGGDDKFVLWFGDNVVNGGSGTDHFEVGRAGHVVIQDFDAAGDEQFKLGDIRYAIDELVVEQTDEDVFINLATCGQGKVTLKDVDLEDLWTVNVVEVGALVEGFVDDPVDHKGHHGAETVDGGNGDDGLRCRGGDDTIVGGRGNDVLTSGEGRDWFWHGLSGAGHDTITDFDDNEDLLDLSAFNLDIHALLAAMTEDGEGNTVIARASLRPRQGRQHHAGRREQFGVAGRRIVSSAVTAALHSHFRIDEGDGAGRRGCPAFPGSRPLSRLRRSGQDGSMRIPFPHDHHPARSGRIARRAPVGASAAR